MYATRYEVLPQVIHHWSVRAPFHMKSEEFAQKSEVYVGEPALWQFWELRQMIWDDLRMLYGFQTYPSIPSQTGEGWIYFCLVTRKKWLWLKSESMQDTSEDSSIDSMDQSQLRTDESRTYPRQLPGVGKGKSWEQNVLHTNWLYILLPSIIHRYPWVMDASMLNPSEIRSQEDCVTNWFCQRRQHWKLSLCFKSVYKSSEKTSQVNTVSEAKSMQC
jgi:hypothetical protein